MNLIADLRVLYHLALKPVRGHSHAERLQNFYRGQSRDYDAFREHLLAGRRKLFSQLPVPDGGIWLDIGGGTASNLESLGDRLSKLSRAYVVDLCPALLDIARDRIRRRGWTNVEPLLADATTADLPAADVITFSYSLTMIPDWFAAIDMARRVLKPGGRIGVVDFHTARKFPTSPAERQSWFSRTFWPLWFSCDNVHLNPDHLPYLRRHFDEEHLSLSRAPVPYLPFVRVPYFTFIGRSLLA